MEIKLQYSPDQKAADAVAAEVEKLSDKELFHINVYTLAEKLGLQRSTVLNIFIQGVYDGVFLIDWIFHCPGCGGITHETLSIQHASSENFCGICDKNVPNILDDSIEVFFTVHPGIKKLPETFKQDYIKEIDDASLAGNYCIWKTPEAVRGIDLIQNNLYRELLGSDVLISDQSLQIMKIAILFTDIKGSTQMYSDLGDAKAFGLVREHFRILFDTIKKFDGVPVKTIGDAVMGVFVNSVSAVQAALEAQKALIAHYESKPANERIEVKIGLHSGPALVVTLNNRLDYFGSTVNTAARIQDKALPNEVVISQTLFDDPQIKQQISAVTDRVQRQNTEFKGLEGAFSIYHIPMC